MKLRSIYLYVAVALGLFCYIVFIDSRTKSTDEAKKTSGLLYEFSPGAVNYIRLSNPKGNLVLQKEEGRWKIMEPVHAVADGMAVEKMLAQLSQAHWSRTIDIKTITKGSLEQWNLNPPAISIFFKTDKQTFELLLGRDVAASTSVYARASGRPEAPVQLVNADVKKAVDKSLASLRSRAIFDCDSSEVAKCGIREFSPAGQATQEAEVAKSASGWQLQKPLLARADKIKVESWLSNLVGLNAVDFISDESTNLSAYGLSNPAAKIWVQVKGKTEEDTLLIGAPVPDHNDQVYAKRLGANTVFTLKQAEVDQLLKGLMDVRDRRVLLFDPSAVIRLTVEIKGKTFTLKRDDFEWQIEGEGTVKADNGRVERFLSKLAALTVLNFVKDTSADLKPYGLDNPQAKIGLHFDKEAKQEPIELLVGKIDRAQLIVKTSMDPFIYGVGPELLDEIPKDALSLRTLQVLTLDKDKFQKLTLRQGTNPPIVLTRGTDGVLQANVPGATIDVDHAEALLSIICQLRSMAWLGPVQPSYGLAKPVFRFTIETDKTVSVRFGAALPNGGRVGQVEGQPLCFEITNQDFELITKSPLKGGPPPPPEPAPAGTTNSPAAPREHHKKQQ